MLICLINFLFLKIDNIFLCSKISFHLVLSFFIGSDVLLTFFTYEHMQNIGQNNVKDSLAQISTLIISRASFKTKYLTFHNFCIKFVFKFLICCNIFLHRTFFFPSQSIKIRQNYMFHSTIRIKLHNVKRLQIEILRMHCL